MEQRDILRSYLRPVLKRWWLILAVVPIVTVGTYLYYDAEAEELPGLDRAIRRSRRLCDQLLLGNDGGSKSSGRKPRPC